jgi:type VI secretion system protein ImpH
MASENRGSPADLKSDLVTKGHAFSFFQVIRLLRLLGARAAAESEPDTGARESVWIRPELSLAFPSSDVAKVEERPGETSRFLVTTRFLGLYGVSSPLPTFYTEDLVAEASEDETVTREFLDVINQRIFQLFYDCWSKYREYLRVAEARDETYLERLFCLLGLGEKEFRKNLPQAESLIRYVGLLTQFPRSALGLRALLQDALGQIPVEIIPCVPRKMKLPSDQRLALGGPKARLGDDAVVGEEIEDRMGKFRVRLGPLTGDQFQSLLPDQAGHQHLVFLTRFYLNDPLEFDLELLVDAGEIQTASLGALSWSRLGWDSWIFSGEIGGLVNARLAPSQG